MVFDWNLVGKSWTAQYDKDMMLAELSSRSRQGFQLRKTAGVPAQEDMSHAWPACGGTNDGYQEIATSIAECGDTTRKRRFMYEEWHLRRNDIGWKTKKDKGASLRKKNMSDSTIGGVPNWGVSNRFHALSCETEDNRHDDSEVAGDQEMPSVDRESLRSRHRHSPRNVESGIDSVRRRGKSGFKSKGPAASIVTKYRRKGDGCLSGKPHMYMFKQVPQGFGDTWKDSNQREQSWRAYGGEVIEWLPPQNYEDWYDRNHPMADAVAVSIANALRRNKVAGKILVVGDSTAAYCVDIMRHVSFATLQRKIRRRVSGVAYLSLRAPSGAKYVDFAQQIKEAAIRSSEVFDSLVLLGGWSDDASPKEYIRNMAKAVAEMRVGPFAPFLAASDV